MDGNSVDDKTGVAIDSLSVSEAAQKVPAQYIKLISGKPGVAPSEDDTVFLIRRGDIKNVRDYVRKAQLLPVDLNAIQLELGYTSSGTPELEPGEIQKFNQRVKQHADSWVAIEVETKELARQLDTFTRKFKGAGTQLLAVLSKVSGDRYLTGTIKNLTEEELNELSKIAIESDQKKDFKMVDNTLKVMSEMTASYVGKTLSLSRLASEFERKITDELIPQVELKLRAYKNSPLNTEAEELNDKLDELDKLIEELAQTYKSQVGYAFTGLVFGSIGLIVTGGIFGSQAESTRASKNNAIAQRKEVVDKIDQTKKLLHLLQVVSMGLVDLRGRMSDAEVGAKQLAQVWQHIYKYLEDAADGLGGINNYAELYKFELDIRLVLAPWDDIIGYVGQISSAFNDLV